jgi:DNA-binding CsgD family transcriptional regulator
MSALERELEALGGDITSVLEDLPLPAVLLDREGTVRWQNAAAKELRGDRVGSSFEEFVLPGELEHAQEACAQILCHGEPAELTLRLRGLSGDVVSVEISSVPVMSEGSVVGVFGLARPLTGAASLPPADSGVPTRVAESQGVGSLTPRQLDVLRLLAEGDSTHEIAAALHLSTTTVRNHIRGVLAALGVHTRLQAVVAAQARGLLDR